jgi:hypothetical protein
MNNSFIKTVTDRSRPRHDRPRHDRPRHDRPRRDRPRHDRPRHDRPRRDRPRHDRPKNVNVVMVGIGRVSPSEILCRIDECGLLLIT